METGENGHLGVNVPELAGLEFPVLIGIATDRLLLEEGVTAWVKAGGTEFALQRLVRELPIIKFIL